MSEKPAAPLLSANLYLAAGIPFLVAGIVILLTDAQGLWVVFLALGLVFIVLSTTERNKAAAPPRQAPPQQAPPQQAPPPPGDAPGD